MFVPMLMLMFVPVFVLVPVRGRASYIPIDFVASVHRTYIGTSIYSGICLEFGIAYVTVSVRSVVISNFSIFGYAYTTSSAKK